MTKRKIVHFDTIPAAEKPHTGAKTTMTQTMLPRDFDSEPSPKVALPSSDGDHEPLGNGCYRALRHPGAP